VLPVILLIFELAMVVGTPFSAARSRLAESSADAYGVALTHNPAAFRAMLIKAARINKMDPEPPWYIQLRQGHPSIAARLAAVRDEQGPRTGLRAP
jgi:STE24 endopeptidase